VVSARTERQDLARVAAAEMRQLSEAVSSEQYAPIAVRHDAILRIERHWERLRGYLRVLRTGR
jgi:hypothetical protein